MIKFSLRTSDLERPPSSLATNLRAIFFSLSIQQYRPYLLAALPQPSRSLLTHLPPFKHRPPQAPFAHPPNPLSFLICPSPARDNHRPEMVQGRMGMLCIRPFHQRRHALLSSLKLTLYSFPQRLVKRHAVSRWLLVRRRKRQIPQIMYAHTRCKDKNILRAERSESLAKRVVDARGRRGWERDLDYRHFERVRNRVKY